MNQNQPDERPHPYTADEDLKATFAELSQPASDTPRTKAAIIGDGFPTPVVYASEMEKLERELNEAKAQLTTMENGWRNELSSLRSQLAAKEAEVDRLIHDYQRQKSQLSTCETTMGKMAKDADEQLAQAKRELDEFKNFLSNSKVANRHLRKLLRDCKTDLKVALETGHWVGQDEAYEKIQSLEAELEEARKAANLYFTMRELSDNATEIAELRERERDQWRELARELGEELRNVIHGGHQRITDLGGCCDSVEYMISRNPALAKLAQMEEGK